MRGNSKVFMRMGRAFAEEWFRFWDRMDDLVDVCADVWNAGMDKLLDGLDWVTDVIAQAGLAAGSLGADLARAAWELVRLRVDKPDAPR